MLCVGVGSVLLLDSPVRMRGVLGLCCLSRHVGRVVPAVVGVRVLVGRWGRRTVGFVDRLAGEVVRRVGLGGLTDLLVRREHSA